MTDHATAEPRAVLVTGGSRGLGLAIVETLARDGFRVAAVARKSGEALEKAIAAAPEGAIRFIPCDIGDTAALQPLVRAVRAEVGPLYGLVNNAGIGTPGLLATMPNAEIERLVAINTLAPMMLTKFVVRGMMAAGRGRIVNIASVVASTGYNALSVYGATKASLIGFTRSLAREVGRVGVTVNAVAPGFVDTSLTENMEEEDRARIAARAALRRLADPQDIGEAVAFLLSERARNISGTVLTVDAGSTA